MESNLIFTRQDGNPLTMGTDYAICCGIWEEGYVDKNTLKVSLTIDAMIGSEFSM